MRLPVPVAVEWYDAAISVDFDGYPEEIEEHDPDRQLVTTYGLLVKHGRVNLILATDVAGIKLRSYRTLTRIPIKLVRKVWRLSPGRRGSSMARGA